MDRQNGDRSRGTRRRKNDPLRLHPKGQQGSATQPGRHYTGGLPLRGQGRPGGVAGVDRGTRPASVHRDAASHRQPEGGEHRLHRGHRYRRLAAAGAHPDVPPASQRQHDDAHGCGASKQAHPQATQGGGFSRRRRFAVARENTGNGRHHHRSQSTALGRAGAKGGYVLTDWFVSGDICGSHRFEHDWVPNDHCLLGCCAGLHSLRDFAAPRYLPGGGMADHRTAWRDDPLSAKRFKRPAAPS